MVSIPLSALELLAHDSANPTIEATDIIDVAQSVERLGYKRVWYAEHHHSLHMVAYPPAVVATRVAAATSTIRVGSGGVLAINHAPMVLAEQFEAVAAFFPGRIDMGIGRGPGTFDQAAARAVRQGREPATEEEYQANMAEILRLVGEHPTPAEPWLLASSPAGAAVAAKLGLPMAFAHFLRPQNTPEAVDRYRAEFRPSRWSDTPRLMLAVPAICAETDAEAAALARPMDILRTRLRTSIDHPLLDVASAAGYQFTPEEEEIVRAAGESAALGTPQVVRARLNEMATQYGADELMLATPIADPKPRIRSYELIMQDDRAS
jgi:luciferase family oxidoreductase group 1